jgi:hypothetical protein
MVPLAVTAGSAAGTVNASGTFTASNVASGGTLAAVLDAMRSGGAYTDIHTAANPDGEIRGQIAKQ